MRTLSDLLRYNHGLRADCWRCKRYVDLDLEKLISDRGDMPYMNVRVRCSQCGQEGGCQLVAPVPFSKRWDEIHGRASHMVSMEEKARLGIDGNSGYAILGPDIQDGEAEFVEVRKSPDETQADAERRAALEAYRRLKRRLGREFGWEPGPGYPDA